MYILVKLHSSLPRNILKKIFFGIVYPHILYCLPVFGVASYSATKPVETMLKRFIRLISGSRNLLSHTTPMFRELKLLKFKDLVELQLLKYMHRILNNKTCNFLKNSLQHNQIRRNINLRNNSHIDSPFYTLTKSRQALLYRGPAIWNRLPNETKAERNAKLFETSIKLNYLNSYNS